MGDELKIILAFTIVFFLGVLVTLIGCFKSNIYNEPKQLIAQCEKELPRNQQCELYAKPKE